MARHRDRSNARRLWAVGLTAGLVLDAGIILVAVNVSRGGDEAPASTQPADPLAGCPTRTTLRVVAPPVAVPLLEEAAAATCTELDLSEAGGRDGVRLSRDTDLWVTDSSVWAVARPWDAGEPVSIASSPIVATADPALAQDLGGDHLNWRSLLTPRRGFTVGLYDPEQTATGVLAAWPVLQAERNVNDVPFTSLALTANALADPTVIPEGALSAPRMRTLVLAGEYAVEPSPDLQVMRGVPGEAWLDFPAYVVAKDTTSRAEADQLVAELASSRMADARAAARLRDPEGTAHFDTTGLGEPTSQLRAPTLGTTYKLFGLGASGSTRGRLLVLLDVSATMGASQANGRPLLDDVRDTALVAMSALLDHTSVGVELMSSDAGPGGHRTLVPLGPLSDNRAAILDAVEDVSASPYGTSSVYPSILDGYRRLQRGYDPEAAQSLVIMTDGRNAEAGGMSAQELRRRLVGVRDPQQPIRIMGIGFGPGADVRGLKLLSHRLGGASARVNGPVQMLGVFITMIGQVAAEG